MNRGFTEMLHASSAEAAEVLVVGGYAVAAHGLPRATGDINLWVRPTPEHSARVWRPLERCGASRSRLTPASLVEPDVVYQIGLPPNRIDILTSIDGVAFEEAWLERVSSTVDGVTLQMIPKRHLLANKRATGRPQDVADVARLECLP